MFRGLWRTLQLLAIILRYRLHQHLPYGWALTPLYIFFPRSLWLPPEKTAPQCCAAALQKMGPLFVKIGQLCSTRADLFPPDWVQALSQLQDQVSAQPSEAFQQSLKELLSSELAGRLVVDWDQPLGSASLAQVYPAKLDSTAPIVLKMRRPNIAQEIERDLQILEVLIPLCHLLVPARLRLKQLFAQLQQTICKEIDFRYEALHAQKIQARSAPWVRCPIIYHEFTRSALLVMEAFPHEARLHKLMEEPLKDSASSRQAAEDLLRFLTYALFRDGFFHADVHPGNMFFDTHTGQLMLVDFGQVGELSAADHFYLCQQVSALLRRDFPTISTLFVEAGWAPPQGFDQLSFQKDLELVLQPLWDATLGNIDVSQVFAQLIVLSRRYQLRMQPGFLLAQKMMMMAEGLARQLHSQIVPLEIFQEDIFKAIKERYGPATARTHWQQQRWRLARWALGIAPLPAESHQQIPQTTTPCLFWLSMGWALFIILSQGQVLPLWALASFLVLWHVLGLIAGRCFFRREV